MYKSVDFQKEQRHPKGKNGADLRIYNKNKLILNIFHLFLYIKISCV